MRLIYSDRFLAESANLPRSVQTKLARLLDLLIVDPFHPLLHTKRLSGKLAALYSFRITRDWRVIIMFEPEDRIRLVKVGHRKDIYK